MSITGMPFIKRRVGHRKGDYGPAAAAAANKWDATRATMAHFEKLWWNWKGNCLAFCIFFVWAYMCVCVCVFLWIRRTPARNNFASSAHIYFGTNRSNLVVYLNLFLCVRGLGSFRKPQYILSLSFNDVISVYVINFNNVSQNRIILIINNTFFKFKNSSKLVS